MIDRQFYELNFTPSDNIKDDESNIDMEIL